VKHPGFTMGWAISADLDGFYCTNNDSYSGIDHVRNSSNTIPIGGCIQSCSNYCQSEVPMGKARQKQPKTRGCRIGNSYSRIERTCLLE
jgi:hypothetical protein